MDKAGRRRLGLVMAYRKRRKLAAGLRRAATTLADMLSLAEEIAGEAEGDLARELARGGHVDHDGRRYELGSRDGIPCVEVSPCPAADGAAFVAPAWATASDGRRSTP